MCPLRIILIFLSATVAGFFLFKNLRSEPQDQNLDEKPVKPSEESVGRSKKVISALCSGFWTCVDMASGRYLWRNFVSSQRKTKVL